MLPLCQPSMLSILLVTGLAAATWFDTGVTTVSVLFVLLVTGSAAVMDVWFDTGYTTASVLLMLPVTRLTVVSV